MLTPREIIAEAWTITTTQKPLRRWGFTASFFETLLNVKLLGYQAYFIYAYMVGKQVGVADDFIWLYNNVALWVFLTILISFALLLVLEFFIPHVCQGAIIGLAAKAYQKQPVRGGLVLALHNFFALFAIHETFVLSGWATLVTLISLQLRYVDGSFKYLGIGLAIFVYCISNVLKLFAGFAEEAVVLRKDSIPKGIVHSYKLLISHLSHIVFLLVLLFVISLRILLNILTVLLIPAIIVGLALVFGLFLSPVVSYSIAGIIGIILIFVASYFFAYLHVFKQTVWTITYIELSKEKELDKIDLD